MVPKALLLAFGVFLVVQTGRIKAKFFRDAKFTGIAIFSFVMACGVGVPVAFFSMFLFQEDLGYIMATGTILICSYVILLMVFVPKFILLRRFKNVIPSAILLGLNPSFRIRKPVRGHAAIFSTLPGTLFARTTQGNGTSVCSRSSESTSSDGTGSFGNSASAWPAGTGGDPRNSVGWECVFDSVTDNELEVQETRLRFGDFECIANIRYPLGACDRRESTDTVMTDLSECEDDSWFRFPSTRSRRLSSRRVTVCQTIQENEELDCSSTTEVGVVDMPPLTPQRLESVEYKKALCNRTKSRSLTVIPSPSLPT